MRQERTVQASIFDLFAGHEIGRELKAMSQWLDEHPALIRSRKHARQPFSRDRVAEPDALPKIPETSILHGHATMRRLVFQSMISAYPLDQSLCEASGCQALYFPIASRRT